MSSPHKTKGQTPSHLVEPPTDLRETIQRVADHVARYGPPTEFQLRSRDRDRQQYPFLYLDHTYAPFYQVVLEQARRRIELSNNVLPSIETEQSSSKASPAVDAAADATENASEGTIEQEDMARLIDYTYESRMARKNRRGTPRTRGTAARQLSNNSEQRQYDIKHHCNRATISPAPFINNYASRPNSWIDFSNSSSSPPPPPTPSSSGNSSRTPKPPRPTIYHPYGPLQEVHLLDSFGSERSGLNTFIITSNPDFNTNPETNVDNSLLDYLYGPPNPTSEEPVYRLRPDTKTVFRATHSRVLPVGYALGAEVQFIGEGNYDVHFGAIGIVVRRTVMMLQRVYDIRDQEGIIWKDIPEGQLRLHEGGQFDFRMPSVLPRDEAVLDGEWQGFD